MPKQKLMDLRMQMEIERMMVSVMLTVSVMLRRWPRVKCLLMEIR